MEENIEEGMDRRTYLRRAGVVAGATVWATPTVQSLMSPAFATGTGRCPEGHFFRFKYDVGTGFNNGIPDPGSQAAQCLPTGYADATPVGSDGSIPGHTTKIVVTISPDGMSATVTIPPECRIEDLQAKAGSDNADHTDDGNPNNDPECDDAEANTGSTATVTLENKEISFVAGVICC